MIQSLLIHTVTVERRTPLLQDGRHTDDTIVTHEAKCLVQPRREVAARGEGGEEIFSDSVLYCNYGVDIQPTDSIVFEDIKYQVIGVLDEGGQSDHYKIYLRRPDYGKGAGQGS